MNLEKIQLKGMLAEAKKNYNALDTEASGIVILLRANISPYVDVINIDTEKVSTLTHRLHKICNEMKILSEKIKKIEAEFE